MTVKKTQQALSSTLEKTEQTLVGLENSLGNNEEVSPLATAENSEANDGLPEGWANCLVGDYLFLKNGYAFKSNIYTEKGEETFPIIRISDIDGRVASDVKAIHVRKDNIVGGFEINDGDLLIAMSGATTGKVGIYKGSLAYQNQRVGNIKLHSKDLGNKLYKNYLIANLTPDILKAAYGGAQPNISGKAIEGIEIPLPPLAEQTVIAQTLDTLLAQVDNIKTRLDAIPKILKTFRQSVLAAAVSGKLTEEWRGENECGEWKQVTLGEVGKGFNYGSSSKSQKEGDVPVLRMGNLQSGKLDWGNLVYTSDPGEIEKYLLESGDVLFNRTNSPELVGKTSIYRGERKSIYAGYLIRVKGSGELNAEFLNILLNSPDAKAYCMAVKSDGVSQSNINARKLRAFSFRNPSIAEQSQIVHRVEELFAFADQIEQQVKNAQWRVNNLTQSILAKAFRGEFTAQWRAENPGLISDENSAEVLLEKIKQKREALKKKPKKASRKKP